MKNHTKKNNIHNLPLPTSMVVLGFMASLLLAGCSSGGGKISAFAISPPDEFAVITNPPLTVPPGDALLPMPIDKKTNANSLDASDPVARGLQTIFGDGNDLADNQIDFLSQGLDLNENDIAILRQAKALSPNPSVRQQLTNDLATVATTDSQVSDYLASAITRERKLTLSQFDSDNTKKTASRRLGMILVQ